MTAANRIAKLENLLTRVTTRNADPRPVRGEGLTPVAAKPTVIFPVPAPRALPSRISVPRPSPPASIPSAPPVQVQAVPSVGRRATLMPPATPMSEPATPMSSVHALPDLDLVDDTSQNGEKRPSLIPSSRPPALPTLAPTEAASDVVQPERIAEPELPREQLVMTVPLPEPPQPAGFRSLLARSLALQIRR